MTIYRTNNKILLVGNGPSLLNLFLGPSINKFHTIVRFNGYQTSGFEEHVGTRTTIWSRWYALPAMQNMDELDEIWLNMPIHERSLDKINAGFNMLGEYAKKAQIIPSPKVATSLQFEMFGSTESTKWPSSGLLAIVHAINLGYDVFLAGFDSWSKEPYHYYEHHDRTHTHHVADLEREYIQDLAKRNSVSFLEDKF
jgi:hypothetical protein